MGASIREVAQEANVSLSTVSKVLNAKPNAKFSAATRERVFAAAKRVGYHPNAIARGLARKRMDTVGLVMAYNQTSVTSDTYLGACLDGILQVSKLRRQKTVLFTEDSWDDALRHLPSYCDGHCDGLLLIIPRMDSEIIPALEARGTTPFVLVGDSRESETLITVDVDNVTAAEEAVAHLIGLGHRRIAAFCGNRDFRSNAQRLEGYRRAHARADLPIEANAFFEGEYWPSHGYENARKLFSRFPKREGRPTAVFCFNDSIARGACDAFVEMGVRIPGELSIVSIDDSAHATSRAPYLTTMRQDIRRVGERAAEVLLARINREIAPGHRAWLPAELVVRETTGPPGRMAR